MRRNPILIWMLSALLLLATACAPRQKIPLRVFFAGSLIIPFEELEKAYEAKNPGIDVLAEGHGSIQVIRHVTDIHELIDVVVTADHTLIPMLMYGAQIPESGKPYADWYIEFATNRLCLAYAPDSRYADEINAGNWLDVISRPDIKLGVADPRFDAAGYRALMALQMAGSLYGKPGLFQDLISSRFKTPISVREEDGQTIIHVPEIVETKKDTNLVLRGYSIQLVSLLESHNLDYAFEYESVVRQHGLKFVPLPDELNLGSEAYADRYAKVQVNLDFQRFASVTPQFKGEPIGYGVTVPSNAPHPDQAVVFVAFLLGPEGQKILQDDYQPLIIPPRADRLESLPAKLKPLCVPLESAGQPPGQRGG